MLQQGTLQSGLQRTTVGEHTLFLVVRNAQIIVFAWEFGVHVRAVARLDALAGQEEFAQLQFAWSTELVRSLAFRIGALTAVVVEANAIVRVMLIVGAGRSLAPAAAAAFAAMFTALLER